LSISHGNPNRQSGAVQWADQARLGDGRIASESNMQTAQLASSSVLQDMITPRQHGKLMQAPPIH